MSNLSLIRAVACIAAALACLFTGTSSALDVAKPDEVYKATLRIVGGLDGKTVVKEHFPAFATPPDSFYQPNETSWTYYAKLEKAGKLPVDCM